MDFTTCRRISPCADRARMVVVENDGMVMTLMMTMVRMM